MPDRKRRLEKAASLHTQPSEWEIAERAYQRWLARGRPIGDGHEDWFAAEADLVAERSSATPSSLNGVRSALRHLGT